MESKAVISNLLSLNHVSHVCQDVSATKRFYKTLLGFAEIKRPSSFDFDGSWLLGYGIGLHLIKGTPHRQCRPLNPRDDHISFVAADLGDIESRLNKLGIQTVKQTVQEGGITVTQVFFHDPDHNMIEICNCNTLPVIPLASIDGEVGWVSGATAPRVTTSRPGEREDNWMALWSDGSNYMQTNARASRSSFQSDDSEMISALSLTRSIQGVNL